MNWRKLLMSPSPPPFGKVCERVSSLVGNNHNNHRGGHRPNLGVVVVIIRSSSAAAAAGSVGDSLYRQSRLLLYRIYLNIWIKKVERARGRPEGRVMDEL